MSLSRVGAIWVALLAAGLVSFLALNVAAARMHGRVEAGDVLVTLLLAVLSQVGFRATRQLWVGDPVGRRTALVFLGVTAAGAVWFALQVPLLWIPVAISVLVAAALARDRPPAA